MSTVKKEILRIPGLTSGGWGGTGAPLRKAVAFGVSVHKCKPGFPRSRACPRPLGGEGLGCPCWVLCSLHETQGTFPTFPSRLCFHKQPFIVSWDLTSQIYLAPLDFCPPPRLPTKLLLSLHSAASRTPHPFWRTPIHSQGALFSGRIWSYFNHLSSLPPSLEYFICSLFLLG